MPHDDFHDWVGTNKHALETDSWQRGAYSWPRAPADMLCFFEQYRISAGNVARSTTRLSPRKASRKFHPPDIGEDVPDLLRIAVRHCRLPHPDVVKRMGDDAVFPVVRGRREQRIKTGTVDGRKVMYDDNTMPRWALLWSHGYPEVAHPQNCVFAHVWDDVKNVDAYTRLANLAILPESFGGLSDKRGPLVPYLRHHAEAVYDWRPASQDPVAKPPEYDDLTWNYLDPIQDPAGFIRRRMSELENQRVKLLRELLGWK